MHAHPTQPGSAWEKLQATAPMRYAPRLTICIALLVVTVGTLYCIRSFSSTATASAAEPSLSSAPLIAHHSSILPSPTSHASPGLSKRVHFASSLVPHLQQWAVARFEPHSRTERHVHPTMTEIFHVKQGRGRLEFDGREAEVLQEDDSIVVPAGTFHVVANEDAEPLVMLYASILL